MTINTFFYKQNINAAEWDKKIRKWIKKEYPHIKFSGKADVVVALGGDGTILGAARKYKNTGPVIIGLNLGTVGFLASVRDENNFLPSLSRFFKGDYKTVEKMMIKASIFRKRKKIFTTDALNEVVIKNPLGMVELQTEVEDHPVQYVRGTGLLVSTATGSTAYNLSAHGPIIVPDIKCLILTELLDHSIPTPSMVVKHTDKIKIKVRGFKKRGILSISETGRRVDVLLSADGETIFPLEEEDEIKIESSPNLIRFAELEKNYFFKSLEEKFGFK